MAEKSLLEQASEQLAKVRDELSKINYQHTENLQIENLNQEQANNLRNTLARLRHQLEESWNQNEIYQSQKAIHNALIFFAKHYPLNERTKGGQWLCPITLQTFNLLDGVPLSNGCYYPQEIIGNYAAGQDFFPTVLPGSDIKIDQRDRHDAQRHIKGRFFVAGMHLGMLASLVVPLTGILAGMIAKVSLLGLLETALIGLGLAAGVAGFVSVLTFTALPLIVGAVVGGVVGAYIYDKTNPAEFAPSPKNNKLSSSTEQIFEEMGVGSDVKARHNPAHTEDVSEEDVLLDDSAPLVVATVAPGTDVSQTFKM